MNVETVGIKLKNVNAKLKKNVREKQKTAKKKLRNE